MNRLGRLIWIGAGLVALPLRAAAQDPPPRWRTQLDLGFTNTTGNSRLRSLSVGEKVEFRPAGWLVTQTLSWVNGSNAGTQTANSLKASFRVDRDLALRLKVFVQVGYERDPFAGLSRRFEESAGLAWGALAGPRHVLDVEAGAGVNQQRAGATETFPVARVAARYRFNLSGRAYAQQSAETLANLDVMNDLRLNTETLLVAPLSNTIALRLSYQVRVDNLPATGKGRTDTVLSSGVQIIF